MEKYQRTDQSSYCLGMSLSIEALLHKTEYVRKIYLSDKVFKNDQFSLLVDLCEKNNIPYIYDSRIIDRLSLKENCYGIAVFDKFYHNCESNNHLVLYGFRQFGELGTILRSAVSFDLKDIIIIDSDIDYFDPSCIRASMGSIFQCNVERYNSFADYFQKYPKQNIYPFTSDGKKELAEMVIKEPFSLIIAEDYYGLDGRFEDSYYLQHDTLKEISLSIRSSIILAEVYDRKRRR